MRKAPLIFMILFSACGLARGSVSQIEIVDWESLKKLGITCRFGAEKNVKLITGNGKAGRVYIPAIYVAIKAPKIQKLNNGKEYPLNIIQYVYGNNPKLISANLERSYGGENHSAAHVSFAESVLKDSFVYIRFASPNTSHELFYKLHLKVLLEKQKIEQNNGGKRDKQ